MLAVQLPSMGSSKPDMPFGYDFDNTNDYSFLSPPAPAPGQPLLDDNETRILENFFDDENAGQFNLDFDPGGMDVGMGWELPPQFMGTSSSFGPQPGPGARLPDLSYSNLHAPIRNPAPSMAPNTSADVLAAASFLSNGPNGRTQSLGGDILSGQLSMQPPGAHIRPHSISGQGQLRPQAIFQPQPVGDEYFRDTYYTDMIFGSPAEAVTRQHRVQPKADIRWGSDEAFGNSQAFTTPQNHENLVNAERSRIQAMEQAFMTPIAPVSTSPKATQPPSPSRVKSRVESVTNNSNEGGDSKPRKRRKSKFKEEEEEEEEEELEQDDVDDDDDEDQEEAPPTTKSSLKKRKSVRKPPRSSRSPSPSSPLQRGHKRRKSLAVAAKTARENLTEDQKRENHIKSEQKRRTLIRQGFEDLNEMVPGLKGGGFSKSTVLVMTAEWLEELVRGNEELREYVRGLEGR